VTAPLDHWNDLVEALRASRPSSEWHSLQRACCCHGRRSSAPSRHNADPRPRKVRVPCRCRGPSVIRGVRGIVDGADSRGSHRTAVVPRQAGDPVLGHSQETRTTPDWPDIASYLGPKSTHFDRPRTRPRESSARHASGSPLCHSSSRGSGRRGFRPAARSPATGSPLQAKYSTML
jgi:hypothetical protein